MPRLRQYTLNALALALLVAGPAAAAAYKTLYAIPASSSAGDSETGLVNVGGTLYGTTKYGGTSGCGALFSVNPVTGAKAVLHSFDGSSCDPISPLINVGGTLYGTTYGTVFSFNPATGQEAVVANITDAQGLLQVGHKLYVTTAYSDPKHYGQILSIDLVTGLQMEIYNFTGEGGSGLAPQSALIDVGGLLYGTTTYGGETYNSGVVFVVDPVTKTEKVIYSFDPEHDGGSSGSVLTNVGGTLYGTTAFSVFSIDIATGAEKIIHLFPVPMYVQGGPSRALFGLSGLIAVGGTLYGTASEGQGTYNQGMVYAIDIKTGVEKDIYSFTGYTDGGSPLSSLVDMGGTLYGTTFGGGLVGRGTVFSLDPTTGTEKVLDNFTGQSPYFPNYRALSNVNGTLFLTTNDGGGQGLGDVVKITPATAAATEIYAFQNSGTGASPQAPLTNFGDTLYGTTPTGGSNGVGTIFSINSATGAEKVAYSFTGGKDQGFPIIQLIKPGTKFFGTTPGNNSFGQDGTVFSFDPSTGAQKTIFTFPNNSPPGSTSLTTVPGALVNVAGVLYGTTQFGGTTYAAGSVFSINPLTGAQKIIYSFSGGADGGNPNSGLINVGGMLYGTTMGGGTPVDGGNPSGTVFSINPVTGAEKVIHSFSATTDGATPIGEIVKVGGKLYGTTETGDLGSTGNGTVFSIDLATGSEQIVHSFAQYGSEGEQPTAGLVNIGNTLYGTTSTGGPTGSGTVFELQP